MPSLRSSQVSAFITSSKPGLCLLLGAASLLAAVSADAATVGYWRFEDSLGFINDSGPDGLTLSVVGTSPLAYPLPGAGAGSAFSNPIPQTGDPNAQAADFSTTGYFERADEAAFTLTTQFTLEVYFNPSKIYTAASGTTGMLASQFLTTGNQRSWFLGTRDNQLRFGLASVGSASTNGNSAFAGAGIELDKDYYAAVVYNAGNVTFYLQNLTDSGPLMTSVNTTTWSGIASLAGTTAPFRIGAYNTGETTFQWDGLIDEVRLSNNALSQGSLLVVPEPTSLALLGSALTLGAMARRRRQS